MRGGNRREGTERTRVWVNGQNDDSWFDGLGLHVDMDH